MGLRKKIKKQMLKNVQQEFDEMAEQLNLELDPVNWKDVLDHYRCDEEGMFEAVLFALRQVEKAKRNSK